MGQYSEYIVYVDESGDHALATPDPDYPVFVLAFCIFQKSEYARLAVPRLEQLKFRYFGHDMVVLHEHEIRKSKGEFRILLRRETREAFLHDLNALIAEVPFTIVASCIRKHEFVERRGASFNLYHVALEAGLAQVFRFLHERGQHQAATHVVFERRGRREDHELEQEFQRICRDGSMGPVSSPGSGSGSGVGSSLGSSLGPGIVSGPGLRSESGSGPGLGDTLRLVMASKQSNTCGLQLADLVARPIGRHILRPEQPNRALALLAPKLRRGPDGEVRGWGLLCAP
jgi:hypothetical protein